MGLKPADGASAAEWIVSALTTFAVSVTSLVPEGFPSYVRLFHPAYSHDPDDPRKPLQPIRWSEIAAANGTQVHAGMQLSALTGFHHYLGEGQPGVYDRQPQEGSLPPEIAGPLGTVLGRHSVTPTHCWFAVWNGFGATRKDVQEAPTFEVPNRKYFLLGGPLDGITESTNEGDNWHQSANLCWPEDHAWCVATEIDLNTTYIACSEACRYDILATRDLEAFEIEPSTGISWVSDLINPEPQHGIPPT